MIMVYIKFEYEVLPLFYKNHNLKGQKNYKRVVNEIKDLKYSCITLNCDALNYIKECPVCIKSKGE